MDKKREMRKASPKEERMKRIYACIGIFVIILLLNLCSSIYVAHFQTDMNQAFEEIGTQLHARHWTAAREKAKRCTAAFRGYTAFLSIFIRRDYLAALDTTLCAMQCYAAQSNGEEALAELSRAGSQLDAICGLFFRVL